MKDFTGAIDNSLEVLFKTLEEPSKTKNLLDKGKIVYLQIGLFKIPRLFGPRRKFLRLKHSLHGDDPEICLFVPNRKTGIEYKKTTDELIDFVVEYYTELLKKHKVKGITTIMPLKQLRCEYGNYELRRKLVHRFDLFLCKNSLLYNYRFLSGLGKFFQFTMKEPLGIHFPKEDSDFDPEFQKSIERAIYTSSFYMKPFSDNYTVPVGTLGHSKQQLKENLETIIEQLMAKNFIPGGFDNVRIIYLWPSQGKTIPFYVCTEFPTNLKNNIYVKSRRKPAKAVRGEITTQPTKEVVVTRFGDVFVTNLKQSNGENKKEIEGETESEDDEDSFDDESEVEDEECGKKKEKGEANQTNNDLQNDSENDEDIEEMEMRLLNKKRENRFEHTQPDKKRKKNFEKKQEEEEEEEDYDDSEHKKQEKTQKTQISKRKKNLKKKKINNKKLTTKLKKNSKFKPKSVWKGKNHVKNFNKE